MNTCRDVMSPNPVCCLASDNAEQAAQIMKSENVGSIPVVESAHSQRLVGIVTDRDLALNVVANGRRGGEIPVRDVMTTQVYTCNEHDPLEAAFNVMASHQVRRIPVVDNAENVVGIIAQADLAIRTDSPNRTAQMVEEISRPT